MTSDLDTYRTANPLYQQALVIREKALGPEHPSVATSLNNLAVLYHAQGKYAEAEPRYQRALAIVEKALGPEHPHVATALENYAAMLRKTGRATEASKMEARAKAIQAQFASAERLAAEWTPDPSSCERSMAAEYTARRLQWLTRRCPVIAINRHCSRVTGTSVADP